jgi:2-dehydro-3-deoxyphosphogluconate aldolase / (4S)-4-hydroxy-2-oxoglutarate aldolase
MNKETVRNRIEQIGIVPAIRVASADDAEFAVESILAAGIPIAEVTMTVPGACAVIEKLAHKHSHLIIGAGTVVDMETARRCLGAGARFLSSPNLKVEIIDFARKNEVVVFPGALTPTEVWTAWEAGSDFVKVYPCSALGGANYIRALRAPLPQIPLIASGGVTEQTVADFIHAGCAAVGIGRDLVSPEAIRRRQPDWFHELSRRFLQTVETARHPEGN